MVLTDATTGKPTPASRLSLLILRVLSTCGLTNLTTRPQDGAVMEATNLTILNVFLVRFGAMTEKRLVQTLITTQVRLIYVLPCLGLLQIMGCFAGDLQYICVCGTLWTSMAGVRRRPSIVTLFLSSALCDHPFNLLAFYPHLL